MKLTGIQMVEMIVKEDRNLDTTCYRESAPLAHLALLSQPDVFDQVSNPEGLQRDLSPNHASVLSLKFVEQRSVGIAGVFAETCAANL
ncbi:MAG: hypothetical protein IVW56_13130 [Candidatus Binataceae bacterium]|nr:hypothetical protein [Candidatus Binataceae bacterium]